MVSVRSTQEEYIGRPKNSPTCAATRHMELAEFSVLPGRPLCSARVAYAKHLRSSGVSRYLAEAYMETVRQFITFTAVSKAGRNGALGCWLRSIPRRIMAVVVTAALATCVLFFAPTVFAQLASDSLGELLVEIGRAHV